MKAKVIIEDGFTKIILTPQNDFEINIIETCEKNRSKLSAKTNASLNYGVYQNHNIQLDLIETDAK